MASIMFYALTFIHIKLSIFNSASPNQKLFQSHHLHLDCIESFLIPCNISLSRQGLLPSIEISFEQSFGLIPTIKGESSLKCLPEKITRYRSSLIWLSVKFPSNSQFDPPGLESVQQNLMFCWAGKGSNYLLVELHPCCKLQSRCDGCNGQLSQRLL